MTEGMGEVRKGRRKDGKYLSTEYPRPSLSYAHSSWKAGGISGHCVFPILRRSALSMKGRIRNGRIIG